MPRGAHRRLPYCGPDLLKEAGVFDLVVPSQQNYLSTVLAEASGSTAPRWATLTARSTSRITSLKTRGDVGQPGIFRRAPKREPHLFKGQAFNLGRGVKRFQEFELGDELFVVERAKNALFGGCDPPATAEQGHRLAWVHLMPGIPLAEGRVALFLRGQNI